ncbi:unnamed protein product [Coffea canephora]|uniref:Uncharacterized protein n=1 Tax=Coffea canephora TaxID=49390 RepID=A0A068V366_COFCA|nr:unnamed protein product [Coffea canephora]
MWIISSRNREKGRNMQVSTRQLFDFKNQYRLTRRMYQISTNW